MDISLVTLVVMLVAMLVAPVTVLVTMDTYISEPHLLFIIHSIHSQTSLVYKTIDSRVFLHE